MAASEVLTSLFVDVLFRTNATTTKQAQDAVGTVGTLSEESQKSVDALTKSLDAFGKTLQGLISRQQAVRDATQQTTKATTDARNAQRTAEKDAADATKAR